MPEPTLPPFLEPERGIWGTVTNPLALGDTAWSDLGLAAGAAVSEAVRLEADRAVRVDLDVGWDATQLVISRTGRTVRVRWPAKDEVVDARYEVVVKAPGIDRNVFSSGETMALGVTVELPAAIARLPGLTCAVKYVAPGGTLMGGNRYGQTLFRPLDGVR